jgi:hypothetical protein
MDRGSMDRGSTDRGSMDRVSMDMSGFLDTALVTNYACLVWLLNIGLFKTFDETRRYKAPAKVISTDLLENLS